MSSFITFDDSGIKTKQDFEMPPEGDYQVLIEAAELKRTKAKSYLMIELKCKIQHEKYHATVYDYLVDSGDRQRLMQEIYDVLQSCGCPPSKGQGISTQSFVGKVGTVRVKHDTYDGKVRLKINYWKAAKSTPAPAAPVEPEKKQDEIPF